MLSEHMLHPDSQLFVKSCCWWPHQLHFSSSASGTCRSVGRWCLHSHRLVGNNYTSVQVLSVQVVCWWQPCWSAELLQRGSVSVGWVFADKTTAPSDQLTRYFWVFPNWSLNSEVILLSLQQLLNCRTSFLFMLDRPEFTSINRLSYVCPLNWTFYLNCQNVF